METLTVLLPSYITRANTGLISAVIAFLSPVCSHHERAPCDFVAKHVSSLIRHVPDSRLWNVTVTHTMHPVIALWMGSFLLQKRQPAKCQAVNTPKPSSKGVKGTG